MKLTHVVCYIEDEHGEHMQKIAPAVFLDILTEATSEVTPEDDLAALEAEISRSRTPTPAAPAKAAAAPAPAQAAHKVVAGEVVLPRSAVDPLVKAKTRGELIEQLDIILSQFNARIAKEGE